MWNWYFIDAFIDIFFKSYIIYEDMYWIDRKMIYKWFEK